MPTNIIDTWFNPYSNSNHSCCLSNKIFLQKCGDQSIFVCNKSKQILTLNRLTTFTLDKVTYSSYDSQASSAIVVNGLTYRFSNSLGKTDLLNIRNSYNIKSTHLDLADNLRVVVIGGNANYAHYLFEYLPKIISIATSFGTTSSVFLLNKSAEKWADLTYIIFNLLKLGRPKLFFVPSNPISLFSAENPIFVESSHAIDSHYYIDFDIIKSINSVGKDFRSASSNSRKLYLAREKTDNTWRNLINSDQIRRLFMSNGFQIVFMSRLSQIEQIKLLSTSSHIVVEAGADSFATIFAPPSCNILELLPANFLNGFGPLTSHRVLSHNYCRIQGSLQKRNIGATSIDHDYFISISQIQSYIDSC